MHLYTLPDRKHVPHWVNLSKYVNIIKELPLHERVARAVQTMHMKWVEHDEHNDRYIDYYAADLMDSESESELDDDSDYAEDPDDEWSRKNAF